MKPLSQEPWGDPLLSQYPMESPAETISRFPSPLRSASETDNGQKELPFRRMRTEATVSPQQRHGHRHKQSLHRRGGAEWRHDYQAMSMEMFFSEVPKFDEVLRVVREFQKKFNDG